MQHVMVEAAGMASAMVEVSVNDDDRLGIVVSPGNDMQITEGTSATLRVRLSAQPAANVVVAVVSSDGGAAAVTPASLTFTTGNWNVEQVVTVNGVADVDLANESVAIACSSSGLATQTVTAAVTDDDEQAVQASVSSISIAEGSTGAFAVSLRFQPSVNTTVSLVSNDSTAATVFPSTLTFTPANYTTAQTVTVAGTQDDDVAGDQATITASKASS